jgi:Ca2+-binding RTX toxin-like protein
MAMAAPAQASPGDIYFGDSSGARVFRVAPTGGTPQPVSDDAALETPNSVEFDSRGRLLVVDYDAFAGLGGVHIVSLAGGSATELSGGTPFVQPDGIALAPGRIAYVSDLDATGDDGAIFRLDLNTGEAVTLTSGGGLVDALGVAVEPATGRVFASRGGGTAVLGVNPSTGIQTLVSNGAPADPFVSLGGLVRMPNGKLYAQDNAAGKIFEIDTRNGETRKVAEDAALFDSYDMTYDLDGNLLVANGPGGIYRANPRTGAVTSLIAAPAGGYVEGVGVQPARCAGKTPTIMGTRLAEKISGSPKPDVINGFGGNDVIRALGANDIVCGGKGRDRLLGGKGRDRLIGGPGKDRLVGGPKRDACVGDPSRQRTC